MGIEDYIDDEDVDEIDDEVASDYEAYAELHDNLDPRVAAIVDEVIEEWSNDSRTDVVATESHVEGDRAELVYGITNIVMKTDKAIEDI